LGALLTNDPVACCGPYRSDSRDHPSSSIRRRWCATTARKGGPDGHLKQPCCARDEGRSLEQPTRPRI
jgi:hypothetical protein